MKWFAPWGGGGGGVALASHPVSLVKLQVVSCQKTN